MMKNLNFTAKNAENTKNSLRSLRSLWLIPFSAIFAFFAVNSPAPAATVITGTITITNAANINYLTAGSVTFNTGAADTRTWTNTVTSAATQILWTNSLPDDARRLLIHLATYPVANTYLSSLRVTNIILRAYNDFPLTITLSNLTWGYVTMSTGTIAAATVVRVPNTVESAVTKTNVAAGLVDYLNLTANPTAIDATQFVASGLVGLANAQTITGAKTFTNYTLMHAAQTPDSALTNFVANFTDQAYRTITAVAPIRFLQSTNRAAVRSLVLFLDPNGTNRTLNVNASWKLLTTINAVVTNGTIGILSLTTKGTAETDVYAAYTWAQ